MKLALIGFQVKTFQANKDVSNTDFNLFLKQEGSLFALVQNPGSKKSGQVPTRIPLLKSDSMGARLLQEDFEADWIPVAVANPEDGDEVDFILGYYTGNVEGNLPGRTFIHCFNMTK